MHTDAISESDFLEMESELSSLSWDLTVNVNSPPHIEELENLARQQEAVKATGSFVFNAVGNSIIDLSLTLLGGKPVDKPGDYRL